LSVFYDVNQLPKHRVQTEWQLPISGVHSIMMEKFAQDGEGGGYNPPSSFYSSYTHVQSSMYAPAERADTHSYNSPLPLNVLCGPNDQIKVNFLTGDQFS
jgi:hypothetical protein